MTRGILLNGPERRRKWHESQRREIVSMAFSPGSSVAEIARQFDVSTSLIYIWRRQFRSSDEGVSFSPAVVVGGSSGSGAGLAAVTVNINTGVRMYAYGEDVGGPEGYADFLAALYDPNHEVSVRPTHFDEPAFRAMF